MSGQDALNPRQFFHGTYADIPVGGELLPAATIGRSNWEESDPYEQPERAAQVYMTKDEMSAWEWGEAAHHSHRRRHGFTPEGDVRVYEVEPSVNFPSSDEYAPGASRAPSAQVKREISMPPKSQGRLFSQGGMRYAYLDELGREERSAKQRLQMSETLPARTEVPGQQELFDPSGYDDGRDDPRGYRRFGGR